ncbi:sugar ABC transporter substrate-binding protein [Actinoplanes sp. SE50]|uniref:sugar ABC transporter substrate-binding protein n=1 Tax=unclassified Actinoplanes TaxID=2626549 RepID=UPI00023EBB75|nr:MULTISPECIES: substrate-binding domain-containing protein [unclassified Actinoplanes]AEV83978.1 HTH-type transcriptional repressor purR [Actinoplanes sp. SE50/110]ATO81878.1 sugar ABC transporter substrate-binding protein [Actinoplanes sp. SE50]SLL99286.1 sugar ABC transporter substrate-binding protein [Actinoplanes sp. SE50/110]
MRKALIALAAAGLLTSVTLTACDGGSNDGDASGSDAGLHSNATSSGEGRGGVGIVLPDTQSSTRWSNDDPKYLKAAFKSANVPYEIQNAEGNADAFKGIAKAMLDSGIKVLMIANLDSVSAKWVIDLAHSKKIPVIDYDRLTLNGGADYYVSFDNEKVGQFQATGLIQCLKDKGVSKPVIAELNGSPTDNNATLFKAGYDAVLQEKYDGGDFVKGPDQFVPQWDNNEGKAIFTQMLKQWPTINGVLAANDGLGNAAIEVLKKNGKTGIPVTGQDATVQGLQNILAGDQCMTVYKATKQEAQKAADLAIALVKSGKATARDKVKDPETGAYVPSELLTPTLVTAQNMVETVIKDQFVTSKELCTAKFLQACQQYGLAAKPGASSGTGS